MEEALFSLLYEINLCISLQNILTQGIHFIVFSERDASGAVR
jgi:hypothetical protein